MELHQIQYFIALAEELNFTRAAERCGVSQPSLTRAIQRLEEELGAQLVRRERNRTHLTEVGKRIRPRLVQALSLTEMARKEADAFARMDVATLSLGVMCTIGPTRLISLVNHLECQYPQVNLTLRTSSGNEVIEWLLAGEVDAAIIGLPEYPDEIKVQHLYSERYMIAFPKTHRFVDRKTVPLCKLNGENYLERLNCEYMDFFQSTLSHVNPDLYKSLYDTLESMQVRHESEHEDWIQAMVIAGMGCAIIPEFMSLSPEMEMRPLVEPEIHRTISVATVRGRKHTPVVGLFSELCTTMQWDAGPVERRAVIPESHPDEV